jgi:hypothetical protein
VKRLTLAICIVSISMAQAGFSQGTAGSATLDINPVSGMVIATCETDLDVSVQAFYIARVECKVKDNTGKEIIAGQSIDENGAKGYAQVVLTFAGIPGTTYTVTGSHSIDEALGRYTESSPGQSTPYDPFNFGDLEKIHLTYKNMFEWFGAGIGSQN